MVKKNVRRVIAAGFAAAGLLIAAPAATQASICIQCPGGSSGPAEDQPPYPPYIRTATSGVAGGPITATAAWSAPNPDYLSTKAITGYLVHANRVEPRFDAYTQKVWWVVVGTTTSAEQSPDARTLSMTLPKTATYTFQVQAINPAGSSPYSDASNRVTGQ
jgi:hypothetical protein